MMTMGRGFSQDQDLNQDVRIVVNVPEYNWSLVDAFKKGGNQPRQFPQRQLNLAGLSLEERLQKVDKANEVFRFHYVQAEEEEGGMVEEYYKIPLLRDYNVDLDEIKITISSTEYERATAILRGAGTFQRIARAIPYHQLYCEVKEFIEEQGYTLEETVIVGVDRGGRLPSFIMREALGKSESYTLKVDQANGREGELDRERLEEFIQQGSCKDKFVLFVDSTVDSGRQIQVLRRYFDEPEWQSKLGHRGWGIVGSNEDGCDHYKHRNINWGVDPDQTFEDDPELMGVDYAPESRTKVIDVPSPTSEAIKSALLEVPRGVVLDLSSLKGLLQHRKIEKHIDRCLYGRAWYKAVELAASREKDIGVLPLLALPEGAARKKLLIIGNGSDADLTMEEAEYIARSLANLYDAFAGTPQGNPGLLLEQFTQVRPESVQLHQPSYAQKEGPIVKFGTAVCYYGRNKQDWREQMVQQAELVFAVGGSRGTLTEMILALYAQKPVYAISGYGAAGIFIDRRKFFRNHPGLTITNTLVEAVEQLRNRAGRKG